MSRFAAAGLLRVGEGAEHSGAAAPESAGSPPALSRSKSRECQKRGWQLVALYANHPRARDLLHAGLWLRSEPTVHVRNLLSQTGSSGLPASLPDTRVGSGPRASGRPVKRYLKSMPKEVDRRVPPPQQEDGARAKNDVAPVPARTSRAIARPVHRTQHLKQVAGLGDVTIRLTTMGDALEAEKRRDAAPHALKALVYVNYLLSQALTDPPRSPEQANELSAEALSSLVPALARSMGIANLYDAMPVTLDVRTRLDKAQRAKWNELGKALSLDMQKAMAGISETLAFASGVGSFAVQLHRGVEILSAISAPAVQIQRTLSELNTLRSPLLQVQRSFDIVRRAIEPAASVTRAVQLQTATAQPILAFNRIPTDVLDSLPRTVQAISALDLPGGTLDRALRASRVNSALLHTPSFTLAPRLPSPASAYDRHEAERQRLMDAYDILTNLEMSLRRLIARKLLEHSGETWWRKRVPEAVQVACEGKKLAKESDGDVDHPVLAYAYLDDYRAIIMRKDNWQDAFSSTFKSQIYTQACFGWCSGPRQDIAHARPLNDSSYNEFVWGSRWLLAAIEKELTRW